MDLFNIILRPTDLWEYVLHRKLTGGSSLVEVGTSTDPYFFRPSPSFTGATYSKERDKVVGGSVGWNQLVQTTDTSVTVPSGRKYYANINGTKTIGASNGTAISINDGTKDNVIDLTQMFGSTIADHAYTLEQQTSGKGVEFISKLIDLTSYHAYDSGSIKSVEGVQSHDLVGFNQWDEEWELGGIVNATGATFSASDRIRATNFNQCLPNTAYYFKAPTAYLSVFWYDADKAYIGYEGASNTTKTSPTNAHYFKVVLQSATTYNHGICINLSSDKNGQYEPYVKHSYPLDSSLTLRGVPKLSNGVVYYDGDEYESDGAVTRKYGERPYQSGDESLTDAITDGTTTVYKLTTPTTESAQPYTNPQTVDPYGTEEYVTNGLVAVGHETSYLGKFESVGFGLGMGNPSEPSEDEPSEEAEEPSEEVTEEEPTEEVTEEPSEEVTEEITEDSEEPTEEADE